jgi:hypothetical protein
VNSSQVSPAFGHSVDALQKKNVALFGHWLAVTHSLESTLLPSTAPQQIWPVAQSSRLSQPKRAVWFGHEAMVSQVPAPPVSAQQTSFLDASQNFVLPAHAILPGPTAELPELPELPDDPASLLDGMTGSSPVHATRPTRPITTAKLRLRRVMRVESISAASSS